MSWWLLGDAMETTSPGVGQAFLIVVPSLVVMLLPCAAAVHYGHRVVRAGRAVGWLPTAIGGAVGTVWTVTILVNGILSV